MRRHVLLVVPVLLTAACSGSPDPAPAPQSASSASARPSGGGGGTPVSVTGTFTAAAAGATAMTYDPAVVPAGGTVRVAVSRAAAGMQVRLNVAGLAPSRVYGAHLHTKPCATDPAASGNHYQHETGPAGDPEFANPENEIWLDFRTDAQGAGAATAVQTWAFDELTPPRSLVIHATATKTGKDVAGMAGDRVACLTLPA